MALQGSRSCPHSKGSSPCQLAPGVRYCVCGEDGTVPVSGMVDTTVSTLTIVGGQLVWAVRGPLTQESVYTYAVLDAQGTPIQLQDHPENLTPTRDIQGVFSYQIHAASRRDQTLTVHAADLVYAGARGEEFVRAK